jgi:serine/threonine protein kinase
MPSTALPQNYQSVSELVDLCLANQNSHLLRGIGIVSLLAVLDLDARVLIHSVDLAWKNDDRQTLAQILDIAREHGLLRVVERIRQIGMEHEIVSLQVPDFTEWLQAKAIYWFDLYVDPDENMAFMLPNDVELYRRVINEHFDPKAFWPAVLEQLPGEKIIPERKNLLRLLADGKDPITPHVSARRGDVDQRFRHHCQESGRQILRTLQIGTSEPEIASFVYLVLDTDGIIKVFKEKVDRKQHPLNAYFTTELEIYRRLPPSNQWPRFYGEFRIDHDLSFLRQEFCFGQTLADYTRADNRLRPEETFVVIRQLAAILAEIHACGIIYRDLKPENILFDGQQVRLLDFSVSQIESSPGAETPTTLAEPRYAAPENVLAGRASRASDIFQLGIIWFELLNGYHPFAPNQSGERGTRLEEITQYTIPNAVKAKRINSEIKSLLARMLSRDPATRPTAAEIAVELQSNWTRPIRLHGRRAARPKERNTILFPARMGIPHRGHIEYLARMLELGYYLKISLQRAYTITDDDPLPKWLVRKMVAQSLYDRGFTDEDFEFVLTPFCATETEHLLYFSLMPGMEDVVAIASGNQGVQELFHGFQTFEQKTVFGLEGMNYDERSWGSLLRQAVRTNDVHTFDDYAASGVEKILNLVQIQTIYGQPEIRFVPGKIFAALLDQAGRELVKARVTAYLQPEEALVRGLSREGHAVDWRKRQECQAEIQIDGERHDLHYRRTAFDGRDETIYFQI